MKKKVLSILTALLILTGLCPNVRAFADTQTVFYIKHIHTGSPDASGGCYTVPHYHVHSDPGNGECYSPRYHSHTGSVESGGGCYTVAVPHYHEGDDSSAGGCYVPRYHSHGYECYDHKSCYVTRGPETMITAYGCPCPRHGDDATYVTYTYVENHHDCPEGRRETEVSFCSQCGFSGPTSPYDHDWSTLTCSKSSSYIEGYVLGCGHSEGDTDHYEPGCGMEGVIEGYDLTCTKTGNDIDHYDPGCGMENGSNAAAVRVEKQSISGGIRLSLTASVQDLSDGMIDLGSAAFKWYDSEGNELGSGESLTVSQNGTYGLEVLLESDGIDQGSCRGSVNVSEIRSASSGGNTNDDDHGGNGGQGNSDTNGNGDDEGNTGDEGTDQNPLAFVTPTPTATPSTTPAPAVYSGDPGKGGTGDKGKSDASGSRTMASPVPSTTPAILPGKDDAVKKVQVTPQKRTSENEEVLNSATIDTNNDGAKGRQGDKGIMQKAGQFLKTPAGKVISIGLSTALTAAALFALLLLLRRIAIIFNDDAEMKRHLVGIAIIKLTDDGFVLDISEKVCNRAFTNRYELFLGLFMIGRDPETEIMVTKKEKQAMVRAERMSRISI